MNKEFWKKAFLLQYPTKSMVVGCICWTMIVTICSLIIQYCLFPYPDGFWMAIKSALKTYIENDYVGDVAVVSRLGIPREILNAILLILIVPIAEEFGFRGLSLLTYLSLFPEKNERPQSMVHLFFGYFLVGAMLWIPTLYWATELHYSLNIVILGYGVFWGIMGIQTRSIFTPIILHSFSNLFAFSVAKILVLIDAAKIAAS